MEGVMAGFWIDFLWIVGGLVIALYLFHQVMTKILKVERRFFSYNYVNEQHKKIDWYVRMGMIIFLLIGFFINMNKYGIDAIWFLEPWFLILVLVTLTESLRAYMEWKYAENRNEYKLTIFQLLFIFLVITIFYLTNFFGRI